LSGVSQIISYVLHEEEEYIFMYVHIASLLDDIRVELKIAQV